MSRCLDLLSATEEELKDLSNACDPAKFGVNQENVLDETYRKAGKLDLDNFALNFSPEQLGFSDIIRKALLTPNKNDIIFERYKINEIGGIMTYTGDVMLEGTGLGCTEGRTYSWRV